jgi:ketosteroid isomerase-like protein
MASRDEFLSVMNRLADAWSSQDVDAAVDCFTPDAVYMEPPDGQLFIGHDQLRRFFVLPAGTSMTWRGLWFDEATATGAGEFEFGEETDDTMDHGIAVVAIRDGRIAHWHEYLQRGPKGQDTFLATEDKAWTWTIDNYPEPSA